MTLNLFSAAASVSLVLVRCTMNFAKKLAKISGNLHSFRIPKLWETVVRKLRNRGADSPRHRVRRKLERASYALMPSPLIHAVLPTSLLVGSQKKHFSLSRAQWIRFVVFSTILANLPDLDFIPAVLHSEHYFEIRRVWGHNVFSALGFTLLGGFLLKTFVSNEFKGLRGILTAGFLVFSHLLLDSIGHFGHNGFQDFQPTVRLFWPMSSEHFGIPVQVFFVRAISFETSPYSSFLRGIFFCEVAPLLLLVVLGSLTFLATNLFQRRFFLKTS